MLTVRYRPAWSRRVVWYWPRRLAAQWRGLPNWRIAVFDAQARVAGRGGLLYALHVIKPLTGGCDARVGSHTSPGWVAAVTLASTTAALSLLLRRDRVDLLKMAVNRAPA
jgi:hypothetical protein